MDPARGLGHDRMRRDVLRRREFLKLSAGSAAGVLLEGSSALADPGPRPATLALCGDVMTGRGIDQVLPHPSDPRLYEPHVRSALDYVALAERANGPIARPVAFDYPWGDALAAVARARPDAWVVNLETAVTTSDDRAPKGIHYRMHPENVGCLTAAGIDACALANNHVLDWGRAGLRETLATLHAARLRTAGAGRDAAEAEAPALLPLRGGGRAIVFAFGAASSGIPREWAAGPGRPGVDLLEEGTVAKVAATVGSARRPGDVVVASVHWGGNWGYEIPPAQRELAHRLVDEAGVDLVHGHSSHHPKGIEIHGGRPILYGCGDFLTDYEGIRGYEEYRDDLVLLYLATLDPSTGALVRLEMEPFRLARFRLNRPSAGDARWLRETLHRECAKLGTRVEATEGGRFALAWG
jgi:poly-gamma-glutamate capsule biosynthesis protein CapA/YwtB (metallophosphatase superfamily)